MFKKIRKFFKTAKIEKTIDGFFYNEKHFKTHTSLPHHDSALITFTPWQKITLISIVGIFIFGLLINARVTGITFIAILTIIYFLDLLFSFYILMKSLHSPPELKFSDEEINSLDDKDLPIYTILCPLYKEANVLPHFIKNIDALNWPKDKLDVLLLLEEDDKETLTAAKKLNLPKYIRTIIVPDSQPKTKPKACNYGLKVAKGELAVIYDAEDRPDPDQLKKVYLGFQKVSSKVFCLQCKLNYYNSDHNLLTKLFTTEYSLWFDVVLPGLQSIETTIPLGGTSNHFRVKDLKELHAWDPFNVTEDCDLGARLFKKGYKTAIVDSVTLEEANSNLKNWIRQRSRWIKGYFQTYFVHNREPLKFIREHKHQAFIFHLVIGLRMSFILINPILWLATLSYFTLYQFVGPAIDALYPAPIFYMAVISLVFGNFMYLYNYMIGAAKRRHWSLIKYVFFVPIYWAMTSVAASLAAYQLFAKPHYWEKTDHGLHLDVNKKEKTKKEKLKLISKFVSSSVVGGGALIFASAIASIMNLFYNAFLGRAVSTEEFGLVSLISSFLAISGVVTGAVGRTVLYQSAFLFGKHGYPVKSFWKYVRSKSIMIGSILALLWVISIPFQTIYFKSDTVLPFLLFAPVWFIGFAAAVDSGFLSGNLKFTVLSIMILVEAFTKLVLAIILVAIGLDQWVYLAIPASLLTSFLLGWLAISLIKTSKEKITVAISHQFPKKYFATSALLKVSVVAFLSIDVVLARHFLSATQAGHYALLALSGKIVYFLGNLFTQFIQPIVGKYEGAKKESKNIFYKLLLATSAAGFTGFFLVGVFGYLVVPFIFGSKSSPIISLLPIYTFGMASFAVASAIVAYHQVKKQYLFSVVAFVISILEVAVIVLRHSSVSEVAFNVGVVAIFYLVIVSVLHLGYSTLVVIGKNLLDFIGLFKKFSFTKNGVPKEKLKILIFNWRDTKHVWAGGAEKYVHEIAKRWVKDGHKVTLFCGNDGKSPRNEVIDGVQIVRRGGFYTVYLWAFLYYVLRFRNLFDVIVESVNGIPFFTPLYSRIPKYAIIYHVHQEVFRKYLTFPLSTIAMFIEKKVTPFLYRNQKIITISQSSKKELIKTGFDSKKNISVMNPGVDFVNKKLPNKTAYPSFIYIGRLKHYKNIDIAIRAFAKIHSKYPAARLVIAGSGESKSFLENLTLELKISQPVQFLGQISEKRKMSELAKAWVAIQPSSVEGWGITVIEANALGTPVIASNVNGLKDSVIDGKTGFLVPVKNYQILSKLMIELTEDKKLRKNISKDALHWSGNFSWKKSADKFMKVIFQSINKKTNYKIAAKIA